MIQGWISIHRKIQESKLWTEERFTKGQAWVDLLLLANHKDTEILVGYKKVSLKRGQVFTSQVKLATRWQWDRKTVRRFIEYLVSDQMVHNKVDRDIQHGNTVITITNYEKYQGMGQQEGQEKGQQSPSKLPTINNDNNVNNKYNGEIESDDSKDLTGNLSDVIAGKKINVVEKYKKPLTEWQSTAFRYAEALGITLSVDMKPRWLKLFKDASTKPELNRKVNSAYGYLIDYPPYAKVSEPQHRMKYFFDRVYGPQN